MFNLLHDYTVRQMMQNTFYLPTDIHNAESVELLKHPKIDKNAATCFGLHRDHLQLPEDGLQCRPKHVGAFLSILECFNNSMLLSVVCVTW